MDFHHFEYSHKKKKRGTGTRHKKRRRTALPDDLPPSLRATEQVLLVETDDLHVIQRGKQVFVTVRSPGMYVEVYSGEVVEVKNSTAK